MRYAYKRGIELRIMQRGEEVMRRLITILMATVMLAVLLFGCVGVSSPNRRAIFPNDVGMPDGQ